VRLSKDGKALLSCGSDAKVTLWDWRDQEATRHYLGHVASVECCDMSTLSIGARVASGDSSGMLW